MWLPSARFSTVFSARLPSSSNTLVISAQAMTTETPSERSSYASLVAHHMARTGTDPLSQLNDREASLLRYDWPFWARPKQLPPPGDWRIWLLRTGRRWGKTRAGAEWVRDQVENHGARMVALVSDNAADVRDVMIEGASGILGVCPPWNRPVYEPSNRRLTWPNGAQAHAYSAEDPEQLRGPGHDRAWADELGKWAPNRQKDTWDNLMMSLSEDGSRAIVTTTPRPTPLVRALSKRHDVAVTLGHTRENRDNLDPAYFESLLEQYEGTRLGRQELAGELLEDTPGALWTRKMIDDQRVGKAPELVRIVVAIDPAVTSGEDSDETGIIVAGRSVNGHYYVLRDVSGHFTPQTWAQRALWCYSEYSVDRIVAETNNGGDLVEHTLRTAQRNVSFRKVTASRGKRVRAEPVAALYEQGRVHHVGSFDDLEEQMINFVPDIMDSPDDRVDALVWALTDLEEKRVWKPDTTGAPVRLPSL